MLLAFLSACDRLFRAPAADGARLSRDQEAAMKLVRERPSQRLHHRVEAPLYVDINGVNQRVANWSLGGFRIDAFEGDLPPVGQALE